MPKNQKQIWNISRTSSQINANRYEININRLFTTEMYSYISILRIETDVSSSSIGIRSISLFQKYMLNLIHKKEPKRNIHLKDIS